MNQEFLQAAITFFKEQNGTYESMKSQMLAGGISESEIDTIYEEIKRLGLEPKKASISTPAAQSYTSSPTSTFYGTANVSTPASEIPTPQTSVISPIKPGRFLTIFLSFIVLIGVCAGSLFAYIKFTPESNNSVTVSSILKKFGLAPKQEIDSPIIKTVTATTVDELESTASSTFIATSSVGAQILPKNENTPLSKEKLDEILFANKLSTCEKYVRKYVHPLTGETLDEEILGEVKGKCVYIMHLPDNGKMDCKYSNTERVAVAEYRTKVAKAEKVSYTLIIGDTQGLPTVTIDGETVTNVPQAVLNKGVCIIN